MWFDSSSLIVLEIKKKKKKKLLVTLLYISCDSLAFKIKVTTSYIIN